jgi:hypothetical protein
MPNMAIVNNVCRSNVGIVFSFSASQNFCGTTLKLRRSDAGELLLQHDHGLSVHGAGQVLVLMQALSLKMCSCKPIASHLIIAIKQAIMYKYSARLHRIFALPPDSAR